ncbi:hypothetical protein HY384_01850 [Candidatus Daviesbacteria bacterium]|nr:hypothetical protein [Candidatus Daviesbacteria bacterium]
MVKVKISNAFRVRLSEKLMDLGNFVAAGLVIGQLVTNTQISQGILIGGIIGTVILYIAAYIVSL